MSEGTNLGGESFESNNLNHNLLLAKSQLQLHSFWPQIAPFLALDTYTPKKQG